MAQRQSPHQVLYPGRRHPGPGRAERGVTGRLTLLALPHSEAETEEAVIEGERAEELAEALGELSARARAVLRATASTAGIPKGRRRRP